MRSVVAGDRPHHQVVNGFFGRQDALKDGGGERGGITLYRYRALSLIIIRVCGSVGEVANGDSWHLQF